MQAVHDPDLSKVLEAAPQRWLKASELLLILKNHENFNVLYEIPPNQPSGTWVLANRRTNRYFRRDGYAWSNEAHEKLKIDNEPVLTCCYAKQVGNPNFQRRVYWMLDGGYEHIALVHYRNVEDASSFEMPSTALPSTPGSFEATSRPQTEDIDFLNCNLLQEIFDHLGSDGIGVQDALLSSEFTEPGQNLSTPGSIEATSKPQAQDDFVSINVSGPVLNEQGYNDIPQTGPSCPIINNQWFSIREVSPEWSYTSESTKVVIVGDFPMNPAEEHSWVVSFENVNVPFEIVQQGVICCHAPSHNVGMVRLCITDGNGNLHSDTREFEYRQHPGMPVPKCDKNPEKSLLLKFSQVLLNGESDASVSESDLSSEISHSDTSGTEVGGLVEDAEINSILEELLKDKFMQWLSLKRQEDADVEGLLPKCYNGLIHIISGLDYDWALKPLLNSGVNVNYRDANGWSALHWAARFGRKRMVASLLSEGASAGAHSNPKSGDLSTKTPADIANSHGHKGISALLAESDLSSYCYALSRNTDDKCLKISVEGVNSTVEKVSDKHVSMHGGGTEDQLSVQDSLDAVRCAVQARSRIHEAMRVNSLNKKQLNKAEERDSSGMTVQEMSKLSEKAAIRIQRRYQIWKRRRMELAHKSAVKIQAHVRAHQARKGYDLLWSVGVLEKIILRWYQKGNGLRFSRAAIGEGEEQDILKVFREQVVEPALTKAVEKVSSIIGDPDARLQYRQTLQILEHIKNARDGQAPMQSG